MVEAVRAGRGRARRVTTIGLSACAALLVAASFTGAQWDRATPPREPGAELALFPNGPWVKPLLMGRSRLVADFAWLEAIQYYGAHRKTDRRYPYAETLFRTLVGLDPTFENAYILGALILADDAKKFDAADALLSSGMAANPASWRLAFERGFLHYMRGPDRAVAAQFLAQSAAIEGAPESVPRLAAYVAGRSGDRELAIRLWRDVLVQSDNPEMQSVAEDYLRDLGAAPAVDGEGTQ